MSTFRQKALSEFSAHKIERYCVETKPVSSFFGQNVFDLKKMRSYLPEVAYNAVVKAIEDGERIDRGVATQIAEGMRTWAMERGATHYTHWFHPLNEATAEKHESFVRPAQQEVPLNSSWEKLSYSRSPMLRASRAGACETLSRPVVIRPGIQVRRLSLWIRPFVSPLFLFLIRERRSTSRHLI